MTHYTDFDAIVDRRGNARAVCGRIANEKHGETSNDPTCPRCAAWVKARDEEPLPAWATEKWAAR